MPASRVRGSRVTEGRCIENESVAIRPEVESIEIRSTLVRPDHAAFKFKTLDEGTIVPFHTELRVSVIEGVVCQSVTLSPFQNCPSITMLFSLSPLDRILKKSPLTAPTTLPGPL